MVVTDAVESTVGEGASALWFHYDMTSDVLYLRIAAHRDAETFAEESDDGFLVLRCASDEKMVGLTVVNWWRRFGSGSRPNSISDFEKNIEPWADRIAA